MQNAEIVAYIYNIIKQKGIKLSWVSGCTNIDYQRLHRIFNYGAVLNAEELLLLCLTLEIDPKIFCAKASA